jgi:hypothetical protein
VAATAGVWVLGVVALGVVALDVLCVPHATALAMTAALVSAIKPVRFIIGSSCPRS